MGYDVIDRKLVINSEADTVRRIFGLYLEERTVPALLDRLASEDIRTTKRAIGTKGRTIGGRLFSRGHVYKLLVNPIYIGRIAHKGTVHPGQHGAIIDLTTWTAVQKQLTENTQGARTRRRRAVQREYLLAGLLVSERGNRFVPMHAAKGTRRYRYYVEELPRAKPDDNVRLEPTRLPAKEIETATVGTLAGFLRDGSGLMRQVTDLSPDQARQAVRTASEIGGRLSARVMSTDQLLKSLLKRVVFRRATLRVELSGSALRGALLGERGNADNRSTNRRDEDEPDIVLFSPIDLKRRGVQMKLVVDGERTDRAIDLPLVTAISRAHCWAQMLMSGEARSIQEIAEWEGVGATYVGQLLPLGFLAPALVERIVSGAQPAEFTAGNLIWKIEVPLRWQV
jgi:hypothetical protein